MLQCPYCGSKNIGNWKADVVYYNSKNKKYKYRYQYVRLCKDCSREVDMRLQDMKEFTDPDKLLFAMIADKTLSSQSTYLYR